MPVATAAVSGETAADGWDVERVTRTVETWPKTGLLFVGDGQRSSLSHRQEIAAPGQYD